MSDVLCVYYSRSGNTRAAMEEVARALDAEVAVLDDGVDRRGLHGYLRSGRDAMRKATHPLQRVETEKPLSEYRLIVIGSPVWAGRCASPVRGYLKRRGLEMERVAYLLTRSSGARYESVYHQMDLYTAQPHLFEVSLQPGSEGYAFWRDQFIGDIKRYLEQNDAG